MNYLGDLKTLSSIKRYRYKTIKSYYNALNAFPFFIKAKQSEKILTNEFEQFINSMGAETKFLNCKKYIDSLHYSE